MKKLKDTQTTTEFNGRFKEAEKDYQKIMQEILPFVKAKKAKSPYTDGKWVSSRIHGA